MSDLAHCRATTSKLTSTRLSLHDGNQLPNKLLPDLCGLLSVPISVVGLGRPSLLPCIRFVMTHMVPVSLKA